jgi:hypothetical protein
LFAGVDRGPDGIRVRRGALRVHLAVGFLVLGALAQGCFVGRDLYLVDEQPQAATGELPATAAPAASDASDGGRSPVLDGPGSTGDAAIPPPPPLPPPPVADPQGEKETCTPINAQCTKGGGMETCITYTAAGGCSKLTYKHDGKTYTCPAGCSAGADCLPAYYGAYTACQDAVGACRGLATCCNTALPAYKESCAETLKQYVDKPYGDVACKSVLGTYRTNKYCL